MAQVFTESQEKDAGEVVVALVIKQFVILIKHWSDNIRQLFPPQIPNKKLKISVYLLNCLGPISALVKRIQGPVDVFCYLVWVSVFALWIPEPWIVLPNHLNFFPRYYFGI